MEKAEQKLIIESLLFTFEAPITLKRLQGIFPETSQKELRQLLKELIEDYEKLNRSFFLREVANGYQFCTKPDYSEWIRRLKKSRPFRFGRATMETLAIIAYKQPLTRAEVEDIRGVDVSGILRGLLERKIVKIAGKKDVPGKPLLYGTTPRFLTMFGLKSLKELPTLEDVEQLSDYALPLFAEVSFESSDESTGPDSSVEPREPLPPDDAVQ